MFEAGVSGAVGVGLLCSVRPYQSSDWGFVLQPNKPIPVQAITSAAFVSKLRFRNIVMPLEFEKTPRIPE
jgi:hypothetical protein